MVEYASGPDLCAARRQVTVNAMLRGNQPREQRGPRRRANRIGTVAPLKQRSFTREPIDVRRPNVRIAVTAKRPRALVISQDQHDVGRPAFGARVCGGCAENEQQD